MTYEHIDPPFSEAREHDPQKMTLLCGHHQLESSKGLLSRYSIKAANANPKGAQRGYVDAVFDLNGRLPRIFLGTNELSLGANEIFEINGTPVFRIERPERKSRKWLLSAIFYDLYNQCICHVNRNELRLLTQSYDVVQEARRFTIRTDTNEVAFEVEVEPPDQLTITTLKTAFNGNSVLVQDNKIAFENAEKTTSVVFEACNFSGFGSMLIDAKGLRMSARSAVPWPEG